MGALLPELYLHGLSLGDFELALRGLLGAGAPLSASSIARLKATWQIEYERWNARDLSNRELVYVWADGVYVKAGLEKEKACLLVVIGAFRDGHKELLALSSGYRESTESWLAVLRDLKARGLDAPALAVADGAMAFWAARHGLAGDRDPTVLESRHRELSRQAAEVAAASGAAAALRDAVRAHPRRVRAAARRLRPPLRELSRGGSLSSSGIGRRSAPSMTSRPSTGSTCGPPTWWRARSPRCACAPARRGASRSSRTRRCIWRVLRVVERRFRKLDAPELLKDVYEGRRFADGKPITRAIGKEAA